jgi:hypothetical protein
MDGRSSLAVGDAQRGSPMTEPILKMLGVRRSAWARRDLPFPLEPADPALIARRLGIGLAALETYMGAHGGVPDGVSRSVPEVPPSGAAAPGPDLSALVLRALPAPGRRAAWVKRDRPRYFMPG